MLFYTKINVLKVIYFVLGACDKKNNMYSSNVLTTAILKYKNEKLEEQNLNCILVDDGDVEMADEESEKKDDSRQIVKINIFLEINFKQKSNN